MASQTFFVASALLFPTTLATPTPAHLPQWLSPLVPKPGDRSFGATPECYTLPYGGIGFLSHILTYYTILMLTLGRSPIYPLKKLTAWKLDLFVAICSLGITPVLSAFAITRCHSEWPFILIATWKMLLSVSLSLIASSRAMNVRRGGNSRDSAIWLLLYALGIVIGLTGLITLTVRKWPGHTRAMAIICGVFGGIVVICTVLGGCIGTGKSMQFWLALGFGVTMVGILTAPWSDWLLAAVRIKEGGDNWAGLPSSDVAWFCWLYFAAKRLPLFSL